MEFARTEQEWAEHASKYLKVELERAEMTYEELAERLKPFGFNETPASIDNKLSCATMSAHFFLASLAVIGIDSVVLENI